MKRLYALLIGINQYPRAPLQACLNDVASIGQLLSHRSETEYHPLVLLNEQATKSAIVNGFCQHLAQARPQDTALFFFAGHGSREPAAPEWHTIGIETLNSIVGYDDSLTDKELRYLLHLLYQQTGGAHIVTIFDCCHSGDNTRNTVRKRYQPNGPTARPWSSFIFGKKFFPADLQQNGWNKMLPEVPHISLSACAADQSAGEKDGHGLFTQALVEALLQNQTLPTYQQLADDVEARLAIYGVQQPQLYTPVGQRSDLDRVHTRFLLGYPTEEYHPLFDSTRLPYIPRPVNIYTEEAVGDIFNQNKLIARAQEPKDADYVLSRDKNTLYLHLPQTPQWPLIAPWHTVHSHWQHQLKNDLMAVARWEQWRQWPSADDFPFRIAIESKENGPVQPDTDGVCAIKYPSAETPVSLSIRLEYLGTAPVYLSCLLLNRAFGVQPELLSPVQRRVEPGQTIWLMEGYGRTLELIPDPVAVAFQWPFYTEYLLFIAGERPFPVSHAAQNDLPSPMPDTPERGITRDTGLENAPVETEGWTGQRLTFHFFT